MIKFGPAGNDVAFYAAGYKHTIDAAKWVSELGLTAYEYSFGKGILLSDETAVKIGEQMKNYGVSVSVHAPYYINFATPTEEMAQKSYMYVINSLKKLRLLGGNRLVVHPASCGKLTREQAVSLTKERLKVLAELIKSEGFSDMLICIETMGKNAQIGTYEEVIDFCTISENYIPAFDFGHINSLTQGSLKTKADFEKIIDLSLKVLGEEKTRKMHVHFSKIEYGAKGEIKHVTLEDNVYGPEFLPLALVIKEKQLEPVIICESKEVMALDALKLKQIYENL